MAVRVIAWVDFSQRDARLAEAKKLLDERQLIVRKRSADLQQAAAQQLDAMDELAGGKPRQQP